MHFEYIMQLREWFSSVRLDLLLGWTGVRQEQLASCTVCLQREPLIHSHIRLLTSPAATFSQPHILLQTTTVSGLRHTRFDQSVSLQTVFI